MVVNNAAFEKELERIKREEPDAIISKQEAIILLWDLWKLLTSYKEKKKTTQNDTKITNIHQWEKVKPKWENLNLTYQYYHDTQQLDKAKYWNWASEYISPIGELAEEEYWELHSWYQFIKYKVQMCGWWNNHSSKQELNKELEKISKIS